MPRTATARAVEHFAARWPHSADFYTTLQTQGIRFSAIAQRLGINAETLAVQRREGRFGLSLIKAVIQHFAPDWSEQLRDSAVIEHASRGFQLTPEIKSLAAAFDRAHPDFRFTGADGSVIRTSPNGDAPSAAVIPTIDAPPDAPAEPTVAAEPPGPSVTPDEALVLLGARLVAERNHYASQLSLQQVRHAQELAAKDRVIAERDTQIQKLEQDVAEWQALAEGQAAPDDLPAVAPSVRRAITLAVDTALQRLTSTAPSPGQQNGNGKRHETVQAILTLKDELDRFPKGQGGRL